MSDSLLASISFSHFTGDSSIPFDWRLFLCLPILGFHIFCFDISGYSILPACICGVAFFSKSSVGLLGTVSLISLSGCSRVVISSVCVSSPVVFGLYLFVASFWWVLLSIGITGSQNSYLLLYALVQMLVNKALLPDHQTYVSKKTHPSHISNLNCN